MANSIVILCEESPFGKNSVVESIRMATGILAVGDIDNCNVILMGDAVYFLNRKMDAKALKVNEFTNILRLIELSDLEIYVHDEALEIAGLDQSDLLPIDTIKVIDIKEISRLILEADMSFKY